jgi:chromosome partitioning protein
MTDQAYIIVFGNEKGGSGKSTTATQVIIALLYMGYRVASIDLDARQGTLTRYLANRFEYCSQNKITVPQPLHFPIERSKAATQDQQELNDLTFLKMALDELSPRHDFIIIDTPGSDTFLGQMGHVFAHMIITPMNDSFIDLDVLARIDPHKLHVKSPSIYTRMVFEQRRHALLKYDRKIEWIILRNRLQIDQEKNSGLVYDYLNLLSEPYGFVHATGFSENPNFRDLFLKGMTVLDHDAAEVQRGLDLGILRARQEIRSLLKTIDPERYKLYRKA